MKRSLKKALREEFNAPRPERTAAFIRKLKPREITLTELLFQQLGHIGIGTWVLFGVILSFAIWCFLFNAVYAEEIITAIMPLTAAFILLEVKRSYSFHMAELEAATRFSLKAVVFAKLIIMGTASLCILVIISPMLATLSGDGTVATGMRIIIPYLVTMIIGLNIERSEFGRKNHYASLTMAAVFSLLILCIGFSSNYIYLYYTQIVENAGGIITCVLALILMREQKILLNRMEAAA